MLNPKKWNIFCWVGLLLWLFVSIGGNIPYEPEFQIPQLVDDGGVTAVSYSQVYLIGCPFSYLQIAQSQNGAPVKTYRPLIIFINLLTISAVLFGIIYSVQIFIPRFSILTLFIVTACIGLLFAIGNPIFQSDYFYLQIGFIFAIYFAPLIATIPAFLFSRYSIARQSRADA